MITPAELGQLINTKPLGTSPRAAYWREYHQHRQATDSGYRARKIKAALKHKANHG